MIKIPFFKWMIVLLIFLEVYGWPLSLLFNSRLVVLIDDVIAILCMLVILLSIIHTGKIKKTSLNLPIAFFILVFVTSMTINSVPIDVAIIQLRSYLLMFMIYYIILWGKLSDDEITSIFKIVFIMFIPVLISAIYEYATGTLILVSFDRWGNEFQPGEGFRIHSTIGNSIDYGNYCILMIAILIPKLALNSSFGFSKRASAYLVLILLVTLVMAGSRGPLIAVTLSVLITLYLFKKLTVGRLAIFFSSAILVILIFGGTLVERTLSPFDDPFNGDLVESTQDYRLLFLLKTFEVVKDNPFFGTGPGTFGGWVSVNYKLSEVYARYDFSTDGISSIDMFFPHLLGELGFIGVVAYLGLLLRPINYFKKSFFLSNDSKQQYLSFVSVLMCFMLLIIGLFSIALENQMITALFAVVIGLSEKYVRQKAS